MTPSHRPKICLIHLPLSKLEHAAGFQEVANVMQPLGIGYLAAVLEGSGYPVEIIDCRPLGLDVPALVDKVLSSQPEIIGMTATVLEIDKAREVSLTLRKRMPEALLVLGGPQLTADPEGSLRGTGFDLGVMGEGERTLLEVVQSWEDAPQGFMQRRREIPGTVCLYASGQAVFGPARPFIEDLDQLPFPARHLYPPLSQYSPMPASYRRLPLGHMITSRGCPFHCIFCDRTVFGNAFRARSARNVVDEMENLIRVQGAREIKLFDDTFTLDKKRVYEILSEMKSRGIDVPWSCLTRVDCVDESLLGAMKSAGCWQVSFGLESGDPDMLKRMKKGSSVEQNRRAVLEAKSARLQVRAFFVIGMPGETPESIQRTVDFAKSLPIDVVTFYTVTLYPGNELYHMAMREGSVRHHDYSQYNPLIDVQASRLAYVPEGMTEVELKRAIARAHRAFYLRPGYLLRQAFSIRTLEDVSRYWRGFRAVAGF